ncbi:MAG: Pyruvate kinase [Chlamydiales bacterium]|nr:Pyruvate kinase [Chlamydiales bacterium]MCH9635746.1 Pyruvate kinase [Chlamydiales bacterium]MCH9703785.1 pyruvate kinase [Chlamydiota bacterium]
METHTKIVCTLGPATSDVRSIQNLVLAGMNIARLNFSHGTLDEHQARIEAVKRVRDKLGVPVALMMDTKGPEIRLGAIQDGQIEVKRGDRFWLVKEDVEGDHNRISLTPPNIVDALKNEMFLFLDDGYIVAHVVEISHEGVCVEVDNGGVISSGKSVNIPGVDMELPSLTPKDVEDIRFGCQMDIDIVAASFMRSAEDVIGIRKLIEIEGRHDILVMSKIESRQGVENFDAILKVSDGIMVARGDLGVELPLTKVPRLQKMMIRKCYLEAKMSVTATQMLESMIRNPRPTRAEASDVANAIYDSTSAVMLSAETAVGNYPVESVKMMRSIIEESELDFDYAAFLKTAADRAYDVESSVASASVQTAYTANAKAIFAFTTSGGTARLLARLRPSIPIIAMTPNKKVYHQLAAYWGVIPLFCDQAHNIEEAYKRLSDYALEKKLVKHGDLVVITAGTPFGKAGTTNMMIVDSIGDILVRGSEGWGTKIYGKVSLFPKPEGGGYQARGKVVVLDRCGPSHQALLQNASAVILQSQDSESQKFLKEVAQDMPVLLEAKGASMILRDGQLVTLDPKEGAVYKGVVN